MSWFDKAMANAGVDKREDYGQQAIEKEQNAKQEQADYDTAWNYIKHGDVAGFADYSNRNLNYRDIPFLGQLVGHASDATTQGIADLAQFVGAEGVGNYLNDAAQRGENRLPPMSKPELSLDYITDPNGLTSAFGSVVGSMLPIGAAAYLAPVGGLTTAAANAASKVPFVGGLLGQSLPHAIRWGLTGPVEAAMEAGGGERDMREQGMPNEEARQKSWEIFGKNAALLAATNAIGGAALPHIFKGVTKAAQNGSRLAGAGRFAGATGTEVGINAFEEGEQQGIQNSVMDKPYSYNPANWSEDQVEAAKFGVAGTAPFALFGLPATIRNMRNGDNNPLQNDSLEIAEALLNQQQQAERPTMSVEDTQALLNQLLQNDYNQQDQFNQGAPQAQPAMSVQEAQNRMSQPAPTISAENSLDGFDSRYVSKWESQPGATDLANVQQSVKNNFNAAIAEYGDTVTLTGGAEKGYHAAGETGHEGGWKIDVDKASVKDPQKFLQAMAKYGFKVGDEGDHYDLSGHAKGGVGGTVVATPDSFISNGNQQTNATAGLSRFNDKQREAWNEALWVQQQTGIPADYIYRQWAHESGNFTSRLARENNNFGGLTQTTPNGEENKQPDGGNYYRMYNNMHEYAESYVKDFINRYDGKENVKTMEDFVNFLHNNGYFTADPAEYLASMQGVDAPTGGSSSFSSDNMDITIPNTAEENDTNQPLQDAINESLKQANAQNESPFGDQEEPTDKELIQEAKEEAQESGDMDKLQEIIKAERSGDTEKLTKITEQARAKKAKEKTAPKAPEIKTANKNLAGIVRKLVSQAKSEGIHIGDELVEEVIASGDEEQLKNYVGMLQTQIKLNGYEARKQKGDALIKEAFDKNVHLPVDVYENLRKGMPHAIQAAESLIAKAEPQQDVPVSQQKPAEQASTPTSTQVQTELPVKQAQPENAPELVQAESAKNQAQPTVSNKEQVQEQATRAYPMGEESYKKALAVYNGWSQNMLTMAGQQTLTDMQSEGMSVDENLAKELNAGNKESVAYAGELLAAHRLGLNKKKDASSKSPEANTGYSPQLYDNLKQLSFDITEDKAKILNWPKRAIRKANELGFTLSEDEKAIISPEGKRYDLPGTAIEEFRLNQRNAEDAKAASAAKAEKRQEKAENVDNSGDKSANDERKDLIDRVMQGYHDGKKSLDDAKAELKHYRDRFDGMAKAQGKYKPKPEVLQSLNEAVEYADQQLNELATISKEKSDNELSQQENTGKIEVETEESPKQEKPVETAKESTNAKDVQEKEVVGNEQQGAGESSDGGHQRVRTGESEENQPSGAGEVSGPDGREGTRVHESGDGENATGLRQSAGVRAGTELETSAGEGADKRGNQPTVPLTEAEAHPTPTEIPGNDYEIKDTDESTKSEKVRFKQNVDAIKMLKQLEADDRMPTPAEQEILGAYNGWGGLKSAFLDGNEMNKELRDLLTEDEYKAARATINDAFYTPPKIIRAIWEGVSHLGFKGGRVLDPSMGVGNFFGTMPRAMMDKSALRGVELDNLTSRFAKMLYPSAFVENKGFQKAGVADNYFDLAISNIPFGQSMIDGYQVHNFFFANGIDKVRPGGLMVYITSQGSLAGGKDAVKMRNYLAGQADLIAAYKLPSGVFSDAGTQVATDVVIFRKRDKDGKKSPYAQNFSEIKDVKAGNWRYAPTAYTINEYFEAHPENILGEKSAGMDQWGNPALNVKMAKGTGLADVASDLASAMKKLPEDVYQPVSRKKSKVYDVVASGKQAMANDKTRDYEYYYKDGKPVQNQNGQEVALTGQKAKVVDDYLKVKNTLNALFVAESDPKAKEKDVEGLRKKLNKEYDNFVAKHGQLNGKAAANFKDDPSAGMVQALEKPIEETYTDKKGTERKRVVGAEKADIFTTRSIKPVQEVIHVESADDALIASLTNQGGVDLDYMAKLMNSTPDKLISKLKGKLFKNPATEDYETREEYLSGNVRQKLAQAKEAVKTDKSYADNVKELEKVVPEDLVSDEIYVNLGTPWIPVSDVQAFVDSISNNITVKFSRGAALWNVTGYGSSAKYKLKGIDFAGLLDHVLNNKAIQIYDGHGDDRVFNQEKTDAANVAAEELQQDFKDWIWKDKDREKRLVRYYNDNYNNTVVRQYDGQHLNLHTYGMNAKITLKPHQKDVVWRMLQGGNTLIAHCVGAGKTFEMQAAGMEMRRLGIANKPMYCLPNNVVEQFAREFRQLYPNAKLLVLQSKDLPAVEKTTKIVKTEDGRTKKENLLAGKTAEQKAAIMEKRNARNRMLNRIRTEDWDGIIISHNLFQRFPVTPDTAAAFIQQEIDNLENTIREAKADKSMDTRALSRMEDAKKNLQDRLDETISTDVDDIGIPFEELGIDQLFVDEADMFKNLEFATRLGNIRGLSNSKAKRSQDMFIKTQWLTNNMDGRGVVFATGTPVSNTISELYTMMRYLDMKGLKEKGLELFDNWMRTFGDIGQGIERKPTGDGFRKVTMIKRFINMAELTKMFRSFADVKVQDELNLEIPKLKNDKTTVVALEPDAKVVNYIKNVVPERVKKMKSGFKKEKGEDNMLSLTNDLRKLSLTDDKIEACADAIVKKYRDTTDVKGAQLVFCDMGIPKAESDKATDEDTKVADIESPEVYSKLISMLKEKGISEKDIAFIQNYNTKEKRDAVFQKVNKGDVRILIGSTETMGAGTNCQEHLVALHDLDAPWRPRDLEQRHGRILRQGNQNKEVEIYNYVVKDSFDANMWEKLKNKAAIIQQAMSGDMTMRTVEDADLVTLSYAEVEGAATGNPLIKEQLQVQNDLTKYQHAQTAFRKKVRDAENVLAGSEETVAEEERVIAKIKKDIAERTDTKGDKFSMLINGKGYKDRSKADEALAKILDAYKQQKSMDIGKIGGFRLTARYNPNIEGVQLQLVNNRAYSVKTNSVQGIENTLRKAPDDALESRQKSLDSYKQDVAQAKEIVAEENPYAEKVKELSDRLNQLNREIENTLVDDGRQKVEQAEDTAIDAEPEQETKEPAKEEQPKAKPEPVSDHIIVATVPPAGKSTANVNVDEFKHTKTGEMIPAASLKDNVPKEFHKQATALAKNHGGKWSPFAKKILFKTEQGRDDFVREMEAILSVGEGKASVEGEMQRAMKNAMPVANEDLTSQERKISEFGKQMGTPILWVDANPKLHGYHAPNGTTVLNRRSNMSLSQTFWHETFHWITNNPRNGGIADELMDYFKGKITKKQIDAYVKRTGRTDLATDEEVIEEMLADAFEDVSQRVKIFKEMGVEQPSLAQKFVAWVKRLMDRFVEFFHNPEGRLTTAQRDAFVTAFGRLARDIVDSNGKPLFKVYKEGREIRLPSGQPVTAGLKLSAESNNYELAKGYKTESGRPLMEAGSKEFIIQPNGTKDFGEITSKISKIIKDNIDVDLPAGKIRLRVGDKAEGLIHAKEHEEEARSAGYDSIESLILDVASTFDKIYMRTPETENGNMTYSLVKTGNKSQGIMNGVAPVYLNLESDGEGNYYLVITALPKGDKSLKRQTKKDRLIYSSPGLDTATTSNGGPVSRPVSNDVGAEQGVLPASDKSNGSSTSIISQGKKTVTKNSDKAGGETKFSYGPSNNTNKGFFNCIKNIFNDEEIASNEDWRYRKRLRQMLEKALQVRIKPSDDVSKGVFPLDGFGYGEVVFREKDKVIRAKNDYDFENILPLAGAIIAERLGMVDKWTKASEETRNYIAKWIVTGAPNDTSQIAKDFAKAMQGNQILCTRLEALQDDFIKWENMGYDEKMKRLVSFDNKKKVTWKQRLARAREEFVEELTPVDLFVKSVNAKLTAEGHEKLSPLADPMIAFRLLRGSYGNVITMVEGRGEDAVKALRKNFPNLKDDCLKNFKTMRDILESIGGYQNTEVQKDFVVYCIAHHVRDMHLRNEEIEDRKAEIMQKKQTILDEIEDFTKRKKKLMGSHWLSQNEIAEVKLLEKNIEGNTKRIADLEEKLGKMKLLKTPKEYSQENCERYIKDYDKKYGENFHKAQQDLVHFSNTTAAILYDSGVISYKRYQELMESWPNYVPTFRVFDENEDIDFGDSLEHLEGSLRDFVNPLESIIRNTALFIQRAETNKARLLLANIARCDSSAHLIEEKDAKDNEEKTITFYENGQKRYLVTDPDIVRAVNNFMRPGNSSWWVKIFHAITAVARAAFTTTNPEFFIRNVTRDVADAMIYTKYGYTISLKDIVYGFIHAIKRDEVYYEWLTQGAGQASVLALDRDYTQSTLEKMSRTTKEQFRKNFLSALLDSIQKIGEYSELGTRIATYEHSKKAILKNKPNATLEEIQAAMVEAAFESRDLMDFARHGKAGAEWNKYVAFSNASIQGLDKLYRQLRNPETRGKTMAKLAIYGILPTLILFMMNKDDDEYKEAESWLKETHWLIPMGDTFLRVPKAADVGVRFLSNLIEKSLEASYYNKSHEWTEYFKPFYDALPNVWWTALEPIHEIVSNYDNFTQRNIVPQKEQKLPAYLQYGERQTKASKVLGEYLYQIAPENMKKYTSPRIIEHFIVGYGGTLGMSPLKALDFMLGEKSQSLSIEEMPVIRGFLWKTYKSPESVNDFYKALNKQTELKNEYKMTHKKPEDFNPAQLKRLEQAQKYMQKLKKQEKTIIDSDKWSIHDKEVMQRNIQKKRIEIAKRALGQK